MMQATAYLYGLEGEVIEDPSFRSSAEVIAVVASSEAALGAHRANLVPEWSRYVCVEPAPPMTIEELRAIHARAEAAGYALVEPERRAVAGGALERAIHAFLTDGSLAKVFVFVARSKAKANGVVKVKETRALDGRIESKLVLETGDIAEVALEILRERGEAIRGSELLREARARYGKVSTQDASTIGRVIVDAWFASQARVIVG